MRQRLGFAVALVGNPDILILDEPMSGLDPLGRRSIRELILRLRDEGKTIFFSSHVLGDVEQICDRVGILSKGKLVVQGRLDQLLTGKIERVEIIASGLTDKASESIAAKASATRVSEAGRHFHADDAETANGLARMIYAAGGELVEFTPVRESLEDYFMRKQEHGA
jgi:ABC-2 type transport system ATP-binding protein